MAQRLRFDTGETAHANDSEETPAMIRSLAASLLGLSALLMLPGCYDSNEVVVAPHDVTPPAAPRGLYSVTGDGRVTLHWLGNTESDVAGYHVYQSPCSSGPDCPYDRTGTTSGTSFSVGPLPNGVTRFFAVSAFDLDGNESDLSYEDIYDTPRPAGFGATLSDFRAEPGASGWDFSAFVVRPFDDPRTDVYFSAGPTLQEMLVPDPAGTGIQDMGFASSLDAVDFAPGAGWSPYGGVELIVGHNYVVKTRDNHYAKFRVVGLGSQLVFDWAYQVDAGNRELRARPASTAEIGRDLRTNLDTRARRKG
jgi:hypothetical protein